MKTFNSILSRVYKQQEYTTPYNMPLDLLGLFVQALKPMVIVTVK